ncbi:MAG: GTP cyclohydrolase MptA [Candidatus Bathyarchaeota archaeon]|nr:GTP cyclohydrolase MptA [Candidatus Bathyarchaeota archaeon]
MVRKGTLGNITEVHDVQPRIKISLDKVGIVGVKMPIGFIYFGEHPTLVIPTFSVYVNLPGNQRGIHASRHYETIVEGLEKFAGKTYKLEDVCKHIVEDLLNRHNYVTYAEVRAVGEAMMKKTAPKTGMVSYEPCKIFALASAYKKSDGTIFTKKKIGVLVEGITACPCAQEMLKEEFNKKNTQYKGFLKDFPWATHMQRSYGLIIMDVPDGFSIDAFKLVKIIEESMSSSSYGLLKRVDEAELVKRAVNKPRFVEDCIRFMMKNFIKEFKNLPDNVSVKFKQRSKETIHKHDFVAEKLVTVGELKKVINVE